MAERITLIKATLNNLPLYYLSIFLVPKAVAMEIEKIQRNFLWGEEAGRRKIHWVVWSMVCKRKCKQGLGLGNNLSKNRGLVAK